MNILLTDDAAKAFAIYLHTSKRAVKDVYKLACKEIHEWLEEECKDLAHYNSGDTYFVAPFVWLKRGECPQCRASLKAELDKEASK